MEADKVLVVEDDPDVRAALTPRSRLRATTSR